MKKYFVLIIVLFSLIVFSLVDTPNEKTELVFSDDDQNYDYYEINFENENITSKNLYTKLKDITILRVYPKFSNIYQERIQQKYYNFDTTKNSFENCLNMEKRYQYLLTYYGLIHDKNEISSTGLPIDKVIVGLTSFKYNNIKSLYKIQKITV